ncbi:MAG: rhomboid family intramembrane serine protease [Alistipes sp.]|nr:rhomboid family intramembrane serine protease [Candidatus Minthomonas equi]
MPPVTRNIIILNVIMMGLTWITGNWMFQRCSLFYFTSAFFRPYQFISYLFMHGGFLHLFFNMYTLYFFGSQLEGIWGAKKFFLYYMICGIGAGLCNEAVFAIQVSANPTSNLFIGQIPTVGASGAIYGLLLAYGMLFPDRVIQLIFPPIAMKAKWFVVIFGVLELIFGLSSGITGSNVAHFAHLGGMLFGLVIILIWKRDGKLYN